MRWLELRGPKKAARHRKARDGTVLHYKAGPCWKRIERVVLKRWTRKLEGKRPKAGVMPDHHQTFCVVGLLDDAAEDALACKIKCIGEFGRHTFKTDQVACLARASGAGT